MKYTNYYEAANNYDAAIQEIIRLREVLENIRDLARTGLPPDAMNYDAETWKAHKLNRIAHDADAALKEGEK